MASDSQVTISEDGDRIDSRKASSFSRWPVVALWNLCSYLPKAEKAVFRCVNRQCDAAVRQSVAMQGSKRNESSSDDSTDASCSTNPVLLEGAGFAVSHDLTSFRTAGSHQNTPYVGPSPTQLRLSDQNPQSRRSSMGLSPLQSTLTGTPGLFESGGAWERQQSTELQRSALCIGPSGRDEDGNYLTGDGEGMSLSREDTQPLDSSGVDDSLSQGRSNPRPSLRRHYIFNDTHLAPEEPMETRDIEGNTQNGNATEGDLLRAGSSSSTIQTEPQSPGVESLNSIPIVETPEPILPVIPLPKVGLSSTQITGIVSALVITWMCLAWGSFQIVKVWKRYPTFSVLLLPLISLLFWSELLMCYLEWDQQVDAKEVEVFHRIVHSVFLGFCCIAMVLLFNHRWHESTFRNKISSSNPNGPQMCSKLVSPMIIRSLIGLGLLFCIISTIDAQLFPQWMTPMATAVPLLIFILSDLVLFFQNKWMILDERWEQIAFREYMKTKWHYFLIRYALWSTIPLLWIQWLIRASIINFGEAKVIFPILLVLRMIVDSVVISVVRVKGKTTNEGPADGSPSRFPVYSKVNTNPFSPLTSTPTVDREKENMDVKEEAFFHQMVDQHVDETGCIDASILKEYTVEVLKDDIESGILDESTLFQLLDTLTTMPCDQIFYLLKGLRSKSPPKVAVIDMETRQERRRSRTAAHSRLTRERVPKLCAKDVTRDSVKKEFKCIPERRRMSYQNKAPLNSSVRIPTPVPEGDSEWIYDWMSVGSSGDLVKRTSS